MCITSSGDIKKDDLILGCQEKFYNLYCVISIMKGRKFFDFGLLFRDIKRYKIISLFFVISLLFFFAGIFLEKEIMKFAAVTIILIGALSVRMTWVQPQFMSNKTILFNIASATSNSFLFLGFLLGLIFVIDLFILEIENMNFAIVGSLILSIIVTSLHIAYVLRDYM